MVSLSNCSSDTLKFSPLMDDNCGGGLDGDRCLDLSSAEAFEQ